MRLNQLELHCFHFSLYVPSSQIRTDAFAPESNKKPQKRKRSAKMRSTITRRVGGCTPCLHWSTKSARGMTIVASSTRSEDLPFGAWSRQRWARRACPSARSISRERDQRESATHSPTDLQRVRKLASEAPARVGLVLVAAVLWSRWFSAPPRSNWWRTAGQLLRVPGVGQVRRSRRCGHREASRCTGRAAARGALLMRLALLSCSSLDSGARASERFSRALGRMQ